MEAGEIAHDDTLVTAGTPKAPVPISYGRLIAAGLVGNILEWYDFSIYGYFAVTIGRHFFPAQSLTTSMIEAFGAFGAGFLSRPLGTLLFGWIGDHHGRERALTLSIFAMALPTFLTGLLPDYATIGLLADYPCAPEDAARFVGGRRVYDLDCVPGRTLQVASSGRDGRMQRLRGLPPNFPPIISRVRRLFRPPRAVSFAPV